MKTTIEINGYEIVIEEIDGLISVSAVKDEEVIEEFEIQSGAQSQGDDFGDETQGDEEEFGGEEVQDFEEFGGDESEAQEDDDDDDESETQEDDEENELEGEGEEKNESKLESFQSFLKKRN